MPSIGIWNQSITWIYLKTQKKTYQSRTKESRAAERSKQNISKEQKYIYRTGHRRPKAALAVLGYDQHKMMEPLRRCVVIQPDYKAALNLIQNLMATIGSEILTTGQHRGTP